MQELPEGGGVWGESVLPHFMDAPAKKSVENRQRVNRNKAAYPKRRDRTTKASTEAHRASWVRPSACDAQSAASGSIMRRHWFSIGEKSLLISALMHSQFLGSLVQ
jgi:hypothetical protein